MLERYMFPAHLSSLFQFFAEFFSPFLDSELSITATNVTVSVNQDWLHGLIKVKLKA